MSYKHGVFGIQVPTQDSIPMSGTGTLPVYIGTAPVSQLTSTAGAINVPLLITGYEDAKAKIGYSDDWGKYTLCEAVYAHFKNSIGNIGPIVVINVLDPQVHDDENPVDKDDIIGGIDAEGKRSGLACADLIYQKYNMVPTILAAPGWSQLPNVEAALLEKCQKINGHWDAICVVDIDSTAAKTISAAKSWKTTNAYTSKLEKVCWPKVVKRDKNYWLSTLTVVRMCQTDYANDGIPFESPSNKVLDITGTCLGDGTAINFDEAQASDLNSKGVTTVSFRAGSWVLWGPHNGNYEYGAEMDPRDRFDCNIRMMMYLTNSFQVSYMPAVDQPLNRARVDAILNDAQVWLNSLISDGKMLFAEIKFNEASNPVNSMVEGDFIFDIRTTTTPPGKSLTFSVQYTTQGLNALFGGDA